MKPFFQILIANNLLNLFSRCLNVARESPSWRQLLHRLKRPAATLTWLSLLCIDYVDDYSISSIIMIMMIIWGRPQLWHGCHDVVLIILMRKMVMMMMVMMTAIILMIMIIMVMMIWGWVQFWHSFHCMHCFPYHLTSQHNMSILLNHLQVYCPVRSAPGDALDTATIWLAIILPTVGGPALSFILCVSWITQDIVTCVRDAPPIPPIK